MPQGQWLMPDPLQGRGRLCLHCFTSKTILCEGILRCIWQSSLPSAWEAPLGGGSAAKGILSPLNIAAAP